MLAQRLPLGDGGWWGEGRAPRLTITLLGRSLDAVCAEDMHVHQLWLALELEHYPARLVKCVRGQTALLLQLPVGGAGDSHGRVPGGACLLGQVAVSHS